MANHDVYHAKFVMQKTTSEDKKYAGTYCTNIIEIKTTTAVTAKDIKNSEKPEIQSEVKKKECIDKMVQRLKRLSMSI